MKIRLHHCQGIVFRSTSRFKVIAAGRRFGKTVLACIILFAEALKNKDGVYWLVAPTYGQAKELAWNILLKMIPQEVLSKRPNESELKFTFVNGAEIHLKGADNPDTLVGRGLRGLVIDEVAKIRNNQRVWEQILRPSLSDFQGFCIFISTPQGKDYFWELFMRGQRKQDEFESWQFKTSDNPHIQRSEIKAAQETLNERYYRQEYEASFEDYTGLVWPEFNHKQHVISPIAIPDWWEKIGALDVALSGTTAALYCAVDEDGILNIFGEYYEQNVRASEVSDVIRGKVQRWVADPAGRSKNVNREGQLFSLYDEYQDYGITLRPAENEVYAGINRVAEFLKNNRIKIFSTCKNLLAEIERYHWSDEKETASGTLQPKPYKSFDHAVDCLRYLVMSRASKSLEPKPRSKDRAIPLAGELLNSKPEQTGIEKWL